MKVLARSGSALLWLLLFFLAGCGMIGGGNKPVWNQEQLSNYLRQQNQDIGAVMSDLQNDPAIGSLMNSPVRLHSLAAGMQFTAQVLSGRPLSFIPLAVHRLPRGGFDFITNPRNPKPYTPRSPTDLEFKWSMPDNRVAVLSVDWNKNNTPTKMLCGRDGDQYEMPSHGGAALTVDGRQAGTADFTANYDHCNATGRDINQPNAANLSVNIGSVTSLGLNFGFTQNNSTINLTLRVNATATNGDRAALSASLNFNGHATRDTNCFITDFSVDSSHVAFATETNTQAHGHHTTTFDATATSLRRDPASGVLTSLEVSGTLKADGQTVATFSGTLDDFNAACPGAHVTVHTAGGDISLSQLLSRAGVCQP